MVRGNGCLGCTQIEDGVPESERLVSHNLRSKPEPKMSIHEMVLSSAEVPVAVDQVHSASAAEPAVHPGGAEPAWQPKPVQAVGIWLTDGGSALAAVTPRQYDQMLVDAGGQRQRRLF